MVDPVVGVESTIIDCTQSKPSILRPGAITKELIEGILGISIGETNFKGTSNQPKASGLFANHYAPKAKVILTGTPGCGDGLIALDTHPTPDGVIRLASPKTNSEFAQLLYEAFRLSDNKRIEKVFVITPIGDDIAVAINDRLDKAAGGHS
jgi:L-threonylcarbamoyladenylate synthase